MAIDVAGEWHLNGRHEWTGDGSDREDVHTAPARVRDRRDAEPREREGSIGGRTIGEDLTMMAETISLKCTWCGSYVTSTMAPPLICPRCGNIVHPDPRRAR